MTDTFELIGNRIDQQVDKYRDKLFLYYKDKKYTFTEMNEIVNRLSNGFYEIGIRKGSKVAFMLPSDDFFVFCLFANMKLGAVSIPININHQGMALNFIINQSDAEYLIYAKDSHEKLTFIKNDINNVKKIVTYDLDLGLNNDWDIPVFKAEDLLANFPNKLIYTYPSIKPTDLMEIIYTSGTTGPPKGIMWDQNKFDTYTAATINFTENDIIYTPLPLFHGLAQRMLFMCLLNGSTIALASKFSASNFWKDIDKYKATWFNYTGSIIPILLKQPSSNFDGKHTARSCYGCGAPQDVAVWKEFEDRFNVNIFEYYGTTESGAITLGTKPGSVGKEKGSHDVKVINDMNEECRPNEIGELVSRVKNPKYDFSGYYKLKAESKEKSDEGWVKSGDLVYQDEEGYIYFVGRKVESMRRRGENISPWEIENVVNSHPMISESAAVPVPSELGEDDVKICVVLKEESYLSEDLLLRYCEERMANYLVPRYVEFKKALPKTPTEKIERVKLKIEGITENTWDREVNGFQLKAK
ncbi:AMP-binding protein [Bacillus sp. JJ1562]|uniref:AMP-binding protein n=1 Tax=Bacillus sp. JJ1562 TaxID=3122960 RepID=UPI00300180B8